MGRVGKREHALITGLNRHSDALCVPQIQIASTTVAEPKIFTGTNELFVILKNKSRERKHM